MQKFPLNLAFLIGGDLPRQYTCSPYSSSMWSLTNKRVYLSLSSSVNQDKNEKKKKKREGKKRRRLTLHLRLLQSTLFCSPCRGHLCSGLIRNPQPLGLQGDYKDEGCDQEGIRVLGSEGVVI